MIKTKTLKELAGTAQTKTETKKEKLLPITELPPFAMTCSDAALVLRAMNEYKKDHLELSSNTTWLIERLKYYIDGGALLEWRMSRNSKNKQDSF
jgi:hypothetical protein